MMPARCAMRAGVERTQDFAHGEVNPCPSHFGAKHGIDERVSRCAIDQVSIRRRENSDGQVGTLLRSAGAGLQSASGMEGKQVIGLLCSFALYETHRRQFAFGVFLNGCGYALILSRFQMAGPRGPVIHATKGRAFNGCPPIRIHSHGAIGMARSRYDQERQDHE